MSGGWTALVLAGARPGDRLAAAEKVSAKHLAELGGETMLSRVAGALHDSVEIGRVLIAADELTPDDTIPDEAVRKTAAKSAPETVLESLGETGGRLLVTTSDNGLLTPEIVAHFLREAERRGGDLAVGLASRATITARFPEAKRTWLKFRGGAYSGCNLFAAMTPESAAAFAFWREAEKRRKTPAKLARLFGVTPLMLYLTRMLTLDQAFALASRKLGIKAHAIDLPFAEAAIDADKPEDLALMRAILAGEA